MYSSAFDLEDARDRETHQLPRATCWAPQIGWQASRMKWPWAFAPRPAALGWGDDESSRLSLQILEKRACSSCFECVGGAWSHQPFGRKSRYASCLPPQCTGNLSEGGRVTGTRNREASSLRGFFLIDHFLWQCSGPEQRWRSVLWISDGFAGRHYLPWQLFGSC